MQNSFQKPKRFQVLSLDGGGLKGLFTAAFLAEWETHTGRSVTESTDLIAGTSAGGIIALGLGAGYSAADLVEFFTKHAKEIFPPECFEAVGLFRQAKGSRYSPKTLKDLLGRYFGNVRFGESKVRLIIPAYHAESGIHLFKTSHHERLRMDWRESMATIARATAAAPTFLPPLILDQGFRLIDGGVWANNPVQIAVTEALGYLEKPIEDVFALRIGSTSEPIGKNHYPADPGAIGLDTLPVFTDVMMRGQSQAASGGVWQLLGSDRFIEINPLVATSDYRLDRLSEELIGLAKATFRKAVSELGEKKFLDHVAEPFIPIHTDRLEVSNG